MLNFRGFMIDKIKITNVKNVGIRAIVFNQMLFMRVTEDPLYSNEK